MLRKVDLFLNNITTYRLLAYGLSLVAAISLVYSFTGTLSLSGFGLATSLTVLLVGCYITNRVMALVWHVATNNESWFITALILFFILPPAATVTRTVLILLGGIIAMASKFMIARHGKHVFNPAAFAAALLSLLGLLHSSWWIGSSVLWPFTLVLGLLVIRKISRPHLFLCFLMACLLLASITGTMQGQGIGQIMSLAITSSPLIFLGTIMLTEPATMPPRRHQQIIFGVLVATLYISHWQITGLYIYPEVALVIGNVYAYVVSAKYRLHLRLKRIERISDRVYNYVFTPDRKPVFLPGQYLEWTLPHTRQDSRGNRRTFTIASSPTEAEVYLGVKFYEPASSYKQALRAMHPGDSMFAGQLAGNFTLPKDAAKKLVLIAGGIGITPFRSMLQYLIDTDQKRDIVLFYLVNSPDELAYKLVLQQAAHRGVRVIPILTSNKPDPSWRGYTGIFDQKLIMNQIPNYMERTFYLSGPNTMVENTKSMLLRAGIKRTHIISDYFSGY